ncbi:o-succinylbenzoate synthase [Candidatus Gottesmanbacteria bacterium]|nr:o-succinylbenzoate synthase [Candidatus Gottesmanbacteria bacterium]
MTIQKAELFIVDLPLIHPFTTSFGTIDKRSSVIIKLFNTDGNIGWGEAPALPLPLYNSETVVTTMIALQQYLLPFTIGKSFHTPQEFATSYAHVKGHNFAKHGLECAFWCLLSSTSGKSLSTLFGGTRKHIGVGESIGIHKAINLTCDEISLRLSEGYQRIKVKIKLDWDIRLVDAIRKKFGDIPLMVDANSAYTLKDVKILRKLDSYNLMMIEQPLGDTDIIDHATLQKQIQTPICLDESILSADDARKAIEINACKIINIKPGRVGGIVESIKIHDFCNKRSIPVWCGGMLESGIGRAFNIALASLPGFSLPADMSPSSIFYKEDIINPTYAVDNKGFIAVPTTAGLGFSVDEKRLKRYTSQQYSFPG